MRRYLFLISAGMLCASGSLAQIKKHFLVEQDREFNRVNFSFSLPAGTCYISPKPASDPLNIYSSVDLDQYNHSFTKNVSNKTCFVNINLESKEGSEYSQSISYKLFKKSNDERDHVWKIYLNDETPYSLDLKYGIGDAFIDLSDLAVESLQIHTGSADVNLGYLSGKENRVEMEALTIKVDLGSLNVRDIDLAKAKKIEAVIGFGDLFLDYSNGSKVKSEVKASVGAGNLVVSVPTDQTPVIINIKNSLLCGVKLNSSFKEIKDHVYVNDYYHPEAKDLLTFHVDVSMGNIIFKEK